MNGKKIDWKEIKQKMKELVKLEKNENDLWVKLTMIGENDVREDEMVGKMIQSEEEIKQTLSQYINDGEPLDCEVSFMEEEKYMLIKFKEKRFVKKAYEFFKELFFGNFLKKMVEQMMKAIEESFDGLKDLF
ncbi:MAG: hypothetical protein EAX96_00345 [Candidatus Lokiarchaeota archaeon]|nr:hypothetical protein [Candidatus Lokiarchaeota archaeon]